MDSRPIGIFDSGVGGLTVVKAVMKALPNESIVYFGDTARVPYGSKSQETITQFSRQISSFLISKNVKAIVVACNTICSNSFDALTELFPLPFFEVISPAVEVCSRATKNKTVGVICTQATLRSGIYERLLKEKDPEINVYSKACPLFAPLAEEGWTDNTVANITAEIYLQELVDREIDSLILACTHYPILLSCIKRVTGNIKIIDSAEATALKVKSFLDANNLSCYTNAQPEHKFYLSDKTKTFKKLCGLVLNEDYEAERVNVEQI